MTVEENEIRGLWKQNGSRPGDPWETIKVLPPEVPMKTRDLRELHKAIVGYIQNGYFEGGVKVAKPSESQIATAKSAQTMIEKVLAYRTMERTRVWTVVAAIGAIVAAVAAILGLFKN